MVNENVKSASASELDEKTIRGRSLVLEIRRFERCVRQVTSHRIRRSRLFSHCAEIGGICAVKKLTIRIVCGFCVKFMENNKIQVGLLKNAETCSRLPIYFVGFN